MSAGNGNGAAADPGQLAVEWSDVVDGLAALHAQQLSAANLEAARWRAAATGAQAALAELRTRIEALESAQGAHGASESSASESTADQGVVGAMARAGARD